MLTRERQIHRQRRLNTFHTTDFNRFPFNNFTCCLTLFPKCFSSFPHGTCSLSVSRQYLALDGIYHPLRAAFPNNSTRRSRGAKSRRAPYGALTLPGAMFQWTWARPTQTTKPSNYNSRRISNLSFCRFTRRYWGNPCWFLFLRLLICLSSAGSPT